MKDQEKRDWLLLAALLLNRNEPMAPHHVAALRERLVSRQQPERKDDGMTEKTKVGDGPLCDQMQALQERARKLHPIDLHDPQLDTADPYTRLFLLAEYWQRQAKEARACLDDECDRTDSLLTILGLECDRCRSEGGSLIPRKVITLMAESGHPPRFSERDCELLGNGLAYIIREYPDKAEHACALLERMKPASRLGPVQ